MNRTKLLLLLGLVPAYLVAACGSEDPAGSSAANVKEASKDVSLYRAGNRYRQSAADDYTDNVQTVLAQRCTVCHGCGDSPCQLKLTSIEGVKRGSNIENNFGDEVVGQVLSRPPMRLADYRTTDDKGLMDWKATESRWRKGDYYSVTDGGETSLMHQLLEHAHNNPITQRNLKAEYSLYEGGLETRSFECLGRETEDGDQKVDDFGNIVKSELEARAMPFAVERLEDGDHKTLSAWLKDGAQPPTADEEASLATPSDPATIKKWESFFNQDSDKGKLVARYLYEHLFHAHLYFKSMKGEFYELVRSSTAAPKPIQEIVTPLIHDEPTLENETVEPYYRLRKFTPIVVAKKHNPWELNDVRMARWKELFLEPEWEAELPDYDDDNPFSNFESIPSMARARFMQENSLLLVRAMVKADVCTGTAATFGIRDRFWVWFLDPAKDPSAKDPKFGHHTWLHLDPAGFDLEYSYQESFEKGLRELNKGGLSMDSVWDGNGKNPNAWLTVQRHNTSATAHHGAVGGRPETMWLLSYSNFERIFYSLVINFQGNGALSNKIGTWKYMSRVRTEGEDLWISMLPITHRQKTRDGWTREFESIGMEFIKDVTEGDMFSLDEYGFSGEPRGTQVPVDLGSSDAMGDLLALGRKHIGDKITGGVDPLNGNGNPRATKAPATLPEKVDTFEDFEQALSTLSGWRGKHAQVFPNVTLVRAHNAAGELRIYTIIANRGYVSNDLIAGIEKGRDPSQDVLSVMKGITADYPELFIDVPLGDSASTFVKEVADVKNADDWTAVMKKHLSPADGVHVIQRIHPEFWPFLDDMHEWYVHDQPVNSGILDISEYVWPGRLQ